MAARFSVKKVDSKGNIIKNYKVWREANPEALYFDSKLEYNFYTLLTKRGIRFTYHETYLLQESFKSEVWNVDKCKWETKRIQGITWTPDFVLPDHNIVLEAKGRANERFANVLKMFRWLIYNDHPEYRVVVLHSLKELNEFLDWGMNDR